MKMHFGILFTLLCLFAHQASSQITGQSQSPGRGLDCLVASDFYSVHLTAFQNPKKASSEKALRGAFSSYCQDIPATGQTFISMDLLDRDARQLPVEIRVVEIAKSVGADAWTEVETLARVAPQVYKNGVVEVAVDFERSGHYAVKLLVGGEMFADEIHIPLTVAIHPLFDIDVLALPTVLGLIAFILYWLAVFRFKRKRVAEVLLADQARVSAEE